LISIMEVQRYDVVGRIVPGERSECRLRITRPIENSILALLRHPLSPYRKRAQLAIGKLISSFYRLWGYEPLTSMALRSDRWCSTVAQRLPWAIGDSDDSICGGVT